MGEDSCPYPLVIHTRNNQRAFRKLGGRLVSFDGGRLEVGRVNILSGEGNGD